MTDIPHTAGARRASFRRYVLVGALGFALNLALASGFHEWLGLSENAAAALSLACVFALNFVLARIWIYRDRGNWRGQLVRFGAVSASARLGEYALFFVLSNGAGINYLLALAAAQAISFVAKFFLYGKFAFNGPVDHPNTALSRASGNPEPYELDSDRVALGPRLRGDDRKGRAERDRAL
ncbi:MAG: GtrA family protein, partial [Alphaproteobacteria bacterium]